MGRTIIAIFLTTLLATEAVAGSGIGIAVGRGKEDTDRHRLSLTTDWGRSWTGPKGWNITGYWEVGVDDWEGKDNSLFALSLLPVIRFEKTPEASLQREEGVSAVPRIFFDIALGFYLLSEGHLGDRDFSTAFQFGSHGGVGLIIGRFEVGYRFEHISNAGIKEPNPGINFHLFRMAYHF